MKTYRIVPTQPGLSDGFYVVMTKGDGTESTIDHRYRLRDDAEAAISQLRAGDEEEEGGGETFLSSLLRGWAPRKPGGSRVSCRG